MEMINMLMERFPSNIAYQIMSYTGPHPVAAIVQEYDKFMEVNIFPYETLLGWMDT